MSITKDVLLNWYFLIFFFFQIFKAYLGKKKVDLDLLEITTQNLTFFSQFVKIFKVSSLAIFQVLSWYFTTKFEKVSPFFLESGFFFQNFFKVENRWTGLLFQQMGLNLWNFWRNLKNYRSAFGKIGNSQKQWKD